ncbi:hypothetical protein [Streptomyces sp. NPDC059076]|uniref:hypothetical protein n=1 Tax=unclassified Streptomyces TaxID=2593676 RepID=UPI0036A8F625
MSGLPQRSSRNGTGFEECFLYWAEVAADCLPEPPEPKPICLGAFVTPYAARAVRWLCVQAERLANGLDPDPDVPWSAALFSVDARTALDLDLGDAPTLLRAWIADEDARREIVQDLKAGHEFSLEAADWTGRYKLTAWSWRTSAQVDLSSFGTPWPHLGSRDNRTLSSPR